jgi:hypothetical protein
MNKAQKLKIIHALLKDVDYLDIANSTYSHVIDSILVFLGKVFDEKDATKWEKK